jgi:hypothetical protein
VKPRVVHPSPEGDPSPNPPSLRPSAASPEPTTSSFTDRFSRAARFHSILLGRGAHRVRRGLKRIRTPQAMQGITRAIGNRWWPNAATTDQASQAGKRWKLPVSLPRLGRSANADGNPNSAPRTHSTHRLVWDFAVVTAAAAILLVLHHQFKHKRPLRSISSHSMVAAAVVPAGDVPSEKPSFKRHGHGRGDRDKLDAVADRSADSVGDGGQAPSQVDSSATATATATVPQQSEPVAAKSDSGPLDGNQPNSKKDDWSSQTASAPPVSSNPDPPKTELSDNRLDQSAAVRKSSASGDNSVPNLADPPPRDGDSTAPPTKHRHRHHTGDPAVAAAGDNSVPKLEERPAGSLDSTPTSDSSPKSGSPVADNMPALDGVETRSAAKTTTDSTIPPGPSMAGPDEHARRKRDKFSKPAAVSAVETGRVEDSAPSLVQEPKDSSAPLKTDKQGEKVAAVPSSGGDVFGALQDSPSEKHDSKGPDLVASPSADNPADATVHRPRRKRKPPQPDVASQVPLVPADQKPASEPVADVKPRDAEKAPDPLKASDTSAGPHREAKKGDEWSAPMATDQLPPAKNNAGEPKKDPTPEKPLNASADHDAFGGLKDQPPARHEHDAKAAEPVLVGAGDIPVTPAPPTHRRKRKPPELAPVNPDSVRSAEQNPPNGPTASTNPIETKPAEAVKLDPAVKTTETNPTETPKPSALDAPKLELKSSEVKPSEPKLSVSPSSVPSLEANVTPAKADPKPEISTLPPQTGPLAAPSSNQAVHPPADDESQQATVSFSHRMPEKTETGNSLTYRIVVRNNGSKPVKLVEVDEGVTPDHIVQITDPPAESHDQTLHWSLHDLGPHEERTIAITLAAPTPPQPIVRTAAIPKSDQIEEDHAKEAKAVEPEKIPNIQLELIAPTSLHTGESGRVGFRVTNLGPKTAGLKLHLDLPPQLHFERGQQLQYKVGELDEHESREDYLTAVATGAGAVEIQGSILLDGRPMAAAKATCRIAGAIATKQAARPKRDGFVVPASAQQEAGARPAPCNCGP